MNIFKLLPITVIALNLNHYSSFAETEFAENNSEFAETYSVVWDSEKNQADVKKTPKNPIDDFVVELTEGSLIRQAYHECTIKNGRSSDTKGIDPKRSLPKPASEIKNFKEILETKIKKYFSSKKITYNETAVKDFVNQLFTSKILKSNNNTVNNLIIKVKNKEDSNLSQYLSKIFQTEK